MAGPLSFGAIIPLATIETQQHTPNVDANSDVTDISLNLNLISNVRPKNVENWSIKASVAVDQSRTVVCVMR